MKLQYDGSLSNFAFKFNLRRCSTGRTVDFTNAMLIMTSNVGSKAILNSMGGAGIGAGDEVRPGR